VENAEPKANMSTVNIKAPKGYRILTGRAVIKKGDIVRPLKWPEWEPASGLIGTTVKEAKQLRFPWVAARKIKK